MKISKGEFAFNELLYIDPFLLSSGSLFIIIGQLWLILLKEDCSAALIVVQKLASMPVIPKNSSGQQAVQAPSW